MRTYVVIAISGTGNSLCDFGMSDRNCTQTCMGYFRVNEVGGGFVGPGKPLYMFSY